MIFKKKEKESKPKKEKKLPVMKVGTHKKSVITLWLVLLASVSFGVYKNFTAIDMHMYMKRKSLNSALSIPTESRILSKALQSPTIHGAIRRNPLTKEPLPSAAI